MTLRTTTLASLVAMIAGGATLAEEAPQTPPQRTPPPFVYLYGNSSLNELRATNPNHYARAERILSAADELCKPGPDQVYFARFEATQIYCEQMLLKTSYPPKRKISFILDDVTYVALVSIRDGGYRAWRVPADDK
jgi:hypothetical protein